jgi:Mn2+/Fe2+ NRAMP family transporter
MTKPWIIALVVLLVIIVIVAIVVVSKNKNKQQPNQQVNTGGNESVLSSVLGFLGATAPGVIDYAKSAKAAKQLQQDQAANDALVKKLGG